MFSLDATLYFDAVVKLFKSLDTYRFLAAGGITPSSTAKFTLSDLNSATRKAWVSNAIHNGCSPVLGLNED